MSLQTHSLSRRAMALLVTLILMTAVFVAIASTLSVVMTGSRIERRREVNRMLYYTSESGLQRGMFEASRETPPSGVLTLPATEFPDLLSDGITLTVTVTPGVNDTFDIVSTAVDPSTQLTKTLRARIQRTQHLVSHQNVTYDIPKIFDYIYFLNNWAWYWGDTINAFGDSRSNGDFDLNSRPNVYGHLYAHGTIEGAADGWGAGAGYRHPGVDSLTMPNLYNDFTYYRNLAQQRGGTVTNGSTTINAETTGSLFLDGTTNPIVIDGPVVVNGDLIIRGTVTGQGAFYVYRNVYIADDLTYANGPSRTNGYPRPANATTNDPSTFDERRTWVENNLNRDLVAYAARESIFFGDVFGTSTGSTANVTWQNRVWNPYLSQWGNEANVGEDGIPGTSDDGHAFTHDWNKDGVNENNAWYDVDGDATVDSNYNWSRDVATSLATVQNWPTNNGQPLGYNSRASMDIQEINGIFYTNHAFAGHSSRGGLQLNGAIITKDEAIIYTNSIYMSYDERIHSDFRDPLNNVVDVIDLASLLPIVTTTIDENYYTTEVISWSEE